MSLNTEALTSLDNVKAFVSITGSTTADDDLLEDLINRLTKVFENYCGVTHFKATDYVEYIDGVGGSIMFLKNIPIISVTEIVYDPDWVWTSSEDIVDSDDYRINQDGLYVVNKSYWDGGLQSYKVTYNAGYATIPDDLEQSCIEEVWRKYKRRKELDVQIKTLEDGSQHFVNPSLMDSTVQVLSKYKRLRAL